jgi:hypothetical protein
MPSFRSLVVPAAILAALSLCGSPALASPRHRHVKRHAYPPERIVDPAELVGVHIRAKRYDDPSVDYRFVSDGFYDRTYRPQAFSGIDAYREPPQPPPEHRVKESPIAALWRALGGSP